MCNKWKSMIDWQSISGSNLFGWIPQVDHHTTNYYITWSLVTHIYNITSFTYYSNKHFLIFILVILVILNGGAPCSCWSLSLHVCWSWSLRDHIGRLFSRSRRKLSSCLILSPNFLFFSHSTCSWCYHVTLWTPPWKYTSMLLSYHRRMVHLILCICMLSSSILV